MHRPQMRIGSAIFLVALFALTICVVIQSRRVSLLVAERERLRDELGKSWDDAEQQRANAIMAQADAQRQADETNIVRHQVQRLQRELQKAKIAAGGESKDAGR